jgi:hypothetical protein
MKIFVGMVPNQLRLVAPLFHCNAEITRTNKGLGAMVKLSDYLTKLYLWDLSY